MLFNQNKCKYAVESRTEGWIAIWIPQECNLFSGRITYVNSRCSRLGSRFYVLSEGDKVGEETKVAGDSLLHWWRTQCVQCAVCRKGPAKRVRVRMPRAGIQDVCDWMTGVMEAAE